MITLKNVSKGPRMIPMINGGYETIQPGQQRTIDGSKILKVPSELVEVDGAKAADDRGQVPKQPEGLDAKVSEGKAEDLPSLEGKTREQLDEIATDEGVDLAAIKGTGAGGNVLNGDVKSAILEKRK